MPRLLCRLPAPGRVPLAAVGTFLLDEHHADNLVSRNPQVLRLQLGRDTHHQPQAPSGARPPSAGGSPTPHLALSTTASDTSRNSLEPASSSRGLYSMEWVKLTRARKYTGKEGRPAQVRGPAWHLGASGGWTDGQRGPQCTAQGSQQRLQPNGGASTNRESGLIQKPSDNAEETPGLGGRLTRRVACRGWPTRILRV